MIRRRAPDWLTQWEYAHRGLHSHGVPENSRAAAEGAIARGMGIECDIQMSRDNVPLVFHDWELERLTKERGKVALRPADELCRIALQETGQTLWRLAELLDLVAGRVPILVEVKAQPHLAIAEPCIAIAKALADYAGPVAVAVMSFDLRVGEWFAKHAPEVTRGLVITDTLDHGYRGAWRAAHVLERAAPDFLASDVRDIPNALISLWRESGRPLLTWTVRSPETRERGLAHADALIAEGEGLA
ncbi:glycerophosphodiester phosphodiesterase family protein [Erythrobacter sp. sf7]|uniref:Glycerophosphodiester phosphodiesterase family protein n=1 Tax=Erythrobacter fulvus TaxID=2987523 RepID=A0ABT5JRP4_9SPHN|nr:glycerophosphodiester phosphodiesterase family protein [Erythrobacter fulvus]MDC8755431.1 glycerophosphodiester phosphodiesterase family protein [Erythrobacter fulvus]